MSAPLRKLASSLRHFPWQRMSVCLIGCAMEWFFLQTHRNWVWAYFDSLMQMPKPSPELAQVAQISINTITTVTISAMTAVSFIVLFFITGNVAALQSMFKFSSTAQALGSVTAAVESKFEHSEQEIDQTIREFNTPELQQRYGDK